MLAIITAVNFDLEGHAVLSLLGDTDPGTTSRRVNKEKTLDGGVSVSDGGFSHGDKDAILVWQSGTYAEEITVDNMVQNHSEVYLSLQSGFYLAALSKYSQARGKSTLRLLIKERLDA